MQAKVLRQRHPSYDADEMRAHRAIYGGGRAFRALLSAMMPKHAHEMPDVYADRVKLATYANHTGPLIDMLSGGLFKAPAQVQGLPENDFWPRFLAKSDGTSLDWNAWWAALFLDALCCGRAYAWANLPRRPAVDVANRAEEERLGLLSVYLVKVTAEEVIDWGRDAQGALSWVMIEQVIVERESPTSARRRKLRWTAIDASNITQWEWAPEAGQDLDSLEDDTEVQETFTQAHRMGRLPVQEFVLPHGLYALRKMHDPAVSLFRGRHDLDWWLSRSAHALMWLRREGVGGDEAPVVGPGYYIELGPKDDVGYAEPPGHTASLLAEDIKQRKDDLYRVVQAMALTVDANTARSRASGDSKRQDWVALEVVLLAYAKLVLDAMHECLTLVASVRQEDVPKLQTSGLDGFLADDMGEWLDKATMALPFVPSPTFRKTVAKRTAEHLVGKDIDEKSMRQIQSEIDAADDSELMAAYTPPPRTGQTDTAGASNE